MDVDEGDPDPTPGRQKRKRDTEGLAGNPINLESPRGTSGLPKVSVEDTSPPSQRPRTDKYGVVRNAVSTLSFICIYAYP